MNSKRVLAVFKFWRQEIKKTLKPPYSRRDIAAIGIFLSLLFFAVTVGVLLFRHNAGFSLGESEESAQTTLESSPQAKPKAKISSSSPSPTPSPSTSPAPDTSSPSPSSPSPSVDSDGDGFTDSLEVYIGTDPTDKCPDAGEDYNGAFAKDDTWPPDVNNNGIINVSDVKYFGNIPFAADNAQNKRLDLNGDGNVDQADADWYKGKIPAACTE